MSAPSFTDLTRIFGRIGLLSFGGPAAQISLMHRELVEERAWLSEESYLRALSLCMLLPGPEAMQLATYAGWRLRGVPGGLIGGGLFVLPGAIVIAVLALAYASIGQVPLVQAAFLGIKAAVIVIVLQAVLKLSAKALSTGAERLLALLAFFALLGLGAPFPLVILLAAILGALVFPKPEASTAAPVHVPLSQTLRTAALWSAIWLGPLALVYVLDPEFLGPLSLFFSQLAVVTFGGAYAVLAYMTQTVVTGFGWLSTTQMIDALGLAETTPGPLILVTQFVAMLAGIGQSGWALGLLAGALALWMTFIPCFLWIFTAAPYVEALAARPRLTAALRGITASVVGVIAQLALWFALHVLFDSVQSWGALPMPEPSSLNLRAVLLTGVAAALLLWRKLPVLPVLGALALAGIAIDSI